MPTPSITSSNVPKAGVSPALAGGVSVGVLCTFVIAGFLWRRRRHSRGAWIKIDPWYELGTPFLYLQEGHHVDTRLRGTKDCFGSLAEIEALHCQEESFAKPSTLTPTCTILFVVDDTWFLAAQSNGQP